jgi:hypothetical protein
MRPIRDDLPDVGDALEHEPIGARLPGQAGIRPPGGARRRGLEVGIAPTAVAALTEHDTLSILDHLGDRFSGLEIDHHRPQRHPEHARLAVPPVAVRPETVAPALPAPVRLVLVIDEVVGVHVPKENHVSAPAAVAAVGSAPRLIFLPAEADAASSPVPGSQLHSAFVDEHPNEDADAAGFAKGSVTRAAPALCPARLCP